MYRSRLFLIAFLISLLGTLARPAWAFDEINKSFLGGVALGGYDAVSYFTDGRAIKGDKAHTLDWKGARWLFSSEANRERFATSPEAFAPQYGGHCSNQMSLGNLSDIDPNVWKMIDGKLYLFGHDAGRVRWSSETRQRIREADSHWLNFLAS
ncbi:MAG: YHS domain-containing protein [Rhodospirillales bacterium]|nr:YHS domain-containing protein [Rhodospirillales bacterium]